MRSGSSRHSRTSRPMPSATRPRAARSSCRRRSPPTASISPSPTRGPASRAEHLPRLFDRFYKVDPSRHVGPSATGSGLGLSIVRAIVERHGGRITAANAPSGGAMFEIVLPGRAHDRAA